MSQEEFWIKCRVTESFLEDVLSRLRMKAERTGQKVETMSQFVRRAIVSQIATDARNLKRRRQKTSSSSFGIPDDVFNDPNGGIGNNGQGAVEKHDDE